MTGTARPSRWLIISLQGLGDTIMLTPILKYLDAHSGAKLSLLVSDAGSFSYIRYLGLVNLEYTYVWRERDGAIRNVIRLARLLRQEEFDVAYATYPAGRRESVMLFLAKARKKRILRYYKGFFKSWQFLNLRAPVVDRYLHNVEANAQLFRIPIPRREVKQVPILKRVPTVGFYIGSKGATKRWGIANFADLMEKLKERIECHYVVIAGRDEAELVEQLRRRLDASFEALVGVEFDQLARRLSELTLFVSNDSSIGHLASVVGVPTVVLWAFAEFWRVSPYGGGNVVVKKDYPCIPCYDFTKPYVVDCPFHLRCIRDISSSDVTEILVTYLTCLHEGRVPSVDDFARLDFVTGIQRLNSGCLVLSVKGNPTHGNIQFRQL